MRWTIRPRFIDRIRLRHAALAYSEHGWDVTPGACLSGTRFTCERPGCPTRGCHPALERWEASATCDVARVAHWWRVRPHTVLLATGRAFDVLEVPAHLGLRALGLARLHGHVLGPARVRVSGPVAVTPGGRWMFLVRPGDPLRPELAEQQDVVRHGPGSWVPAPPSRLPEGPVRWIVTPTEVRWQLPDSYAVQALLVDTFVTVASPRLAGLPLPTARPTLVGYPLAAGGVPRQTSTWRRAA
jgi:Bifunctional DNA primase/polymerase, N-terminal